MQSGMKGMKREWEETGAEMEGKKTTGRHEMCFKERKSLG